MKFKELKQILADEIVEISLVEHDEHAVNNTISYKPKERIPEVRLLDALFKTQLEELNDFEVLNLYPLNEGFIVEFEYTPEINKICAETCNLIYDR